MAQNTELTSFRIDKWLSLTWVEVDGMPDIFGEWQTLTDDDRFDFILEWDNLLGMIRQLGQAEAAGVMTADQHRRYERLVRRYAEVLPTIRRLGLNAIPVPQILSRTSP